MFQVLFKDAEGRDVLMKEKLDEKSADFLIETLTNSGIRADKIDVGEERIHVVSVVFNLNDIEDKTKWYTFEDPDNIAHNGDVVDVECTDGRRKKAIVVAAGSRTRSQVNEFCAKIGYKALGRVIRLVWAFRK